MHLTLDTVSGPLATTGKLVVGDKVFPTIEQPWRMNLQGHSCIPAGDYELVWYVSPKHGGTYCFRNPVLKIMGHDNLTAQQVAEGYRSFCEIHSANWAEQLEGCLAVGHTGQPMYDPLTGKVEPAVEDSKNAVAEILAILGEAAVGHTITVTRTNA